MSALSWKKALASEKEAAEYWYPGSTELHPVVRTACRFAWPSALYYATRYHSDLHVAHELMDEAVAMAEQYYLRDEEKTVKQVWYYTIRCLKQLSIRRSSRPEVLAGNLSHLEMIAQHISSWKLDEKRVFLSALAEKMSPRTRQIYEWRKAGYSFRAIARELNTSHATLVRAYNKELRQLILPRPAPDDVKND